MAYRSAITLPTTHVCPGAGCERVLPVHLLACPPHWWALPGHLRHAVTTAWRNRKTDPRAHVVAVRAALAWYREQPKSAAIPPRESEES